MPEECEAVDYVIERYFSLNGNGYHNKKADDEIKERKAFREAQSERGKKGADARWGKSQEEAEGMAQAMLKHKRKDGLPSPSPSPSPSPKPTKDSKVKKRKIPMPDDFEISDRVRVWAEGKRYTQLEKHLEGFKLSCSAKGYEYIDWDAAFMKAITDDWAKLRQGGTNGTSKRYDRKDKNWADREADEEAERINRKWREAKAAKAAAYHTT